MAQLKENKEAWTYDHPQHKKITNWIAEMMAEQKYAFTNITNISLYRYIVSVSKKFSYLIGIGSV